MAEEKSDLPDSGDLAPGDLIQVELKGLMLDPSSNVPIVILKQKGGSELLPIWIGVFEANAIALELEGVEPPRPMTHDLLMGVVAELGAELRRVVVSDLDDSTFFATLVLSRNDDHVEVDARPSDAIALALRAEAPIFVAPIVFEKAKSSELHERVTDEEKLKKYLEELDPDELGKYKM